MAGFLTRHLLGADIFLTFQSLQTGLPICLGLGAGFAIAWYADYRSVGHSLARTILVAETVYCGGLFVGILAYFFANANILKSEIGFASELSVWLVPPVYWLGGYGIPSAIAIAFLHRYLVFPFFVRLKH